MSIYYSLFIADLKVQYVKLPKVNTSEDVLTQLTKISMEFDGLDPLINLVLTPHFSEI